MTEQTKEQLLQELQKNILSSLGQLSTFLTEEQQHDLNKIKDDIARLKFTLTKANCGNN